VRRNFSILHLCFFFAATLAARGQYWEEDRSYSPVFESRFEYRRDYSQWRVVTASPGGKVLVGSEIVNGQRARYGFVRLNRDGSSDSSFNLTADGVWTILAVYPDSRVLAIRTRVVMSENYIPELASEVVRLRADGSLDSSFAPFGLVETGHPLARLLPDGRVLLFGLFIRTGTLDFRGITVLGANGSVSSSFQSPIPLTPENVTRVEIYAAEPMPDGRIVVSGSFRSLGPDRLKFLARLNANGSLDPTFNANALNLTSAPILLAVENDGSLLLCEDYSTRPIRLKSSGARDTAYVSPEFFGISSLTPRQSDGKIYYVSNREVRRLNADGTPDTAFRCVTEALPVVADDGTLFVSDPLTAERSALGYHLSRLTAAGTLDPTYSPRIGGNSLLSGHLRLPDASLLVAGTFDYINGAATSVPRGFVRLRASGSLDPAFTATWAAGEDFDFSRLWRQPSGKILVRKILPVTDFSVPREVALVRFNLDGSRDATLTLTLPADATLEVDSAGFLYTTTGGLTPRLVRYTPEGQPDASFQGPRTESPGRFYPLADGTVLATVVDSDGLEFRRLRHDGSRDAGFTLVTGGLVNAYRVAGASSLPDGRAIVCFMEDRGGGADLTIVRLKSNGDIDFRFTPQTNPVQYQYFTAAGVYLDLLREAAAPAGTLHSLRLAYRTLTVDPAGLLFDPEDTPAVYQRTAIPGPSYAAAPSITPITGPYTVSNAAGSSLVFRATASGLEPLSYQWKRNGVAIPGATLASYTIASAQASDTGEYTLTVSNSQGTRTTSPSYISIDASAFAGTYSGSVTGRGDPGKFALYLRPDGTGALLLYLGSAPTGLVFDDLKVAADGSFAGDGRLLGDTRGLPAGPYAIAGKVATNRSVTGTITGIGLTLATTQNSFPAGGGAFFTARATANSAATLYAIIGSSTFVVIADSTSAQGTIGSTSVGRLLFPATSPFAATGTFDFVPGSITATVTSGTFAGTTFTGSRSEIPRTDRLANISTRGRAGPGDDVLIAGFVLSGATPRTVLIRAIGPALGAFGVTGLLADPRLELYRGATSLAANDDWSSSPAAAAIATATTRVGGFALASGSADAALLVTLEPGSYTAQVSAPPGAAAGNALVEVYDASLTTTPAATEPRLINIATRGRIAQAGESLIAGIVISGATPKKVLIRAVGPGLALFGVPGALADPTLIVTGTSSAGVAVFASNDNWNITRTGVYDSAIDSAAVSVGAFPLPFLSADACLLLTLAPGNYTAQVTGKSNGTGVALIEVYEVNN
jgi:uncharacterized delta-60 repeat protein